MIVTGALLKSLHLSLHTNYHHTLPLPSRRSTLMHTYGLKPLSAFCAGEGWTLSSQTRLQGRILNCEMQHGEVIRIIYLHCQHIMESLASSVLMIWHNCTLTCRSTPPSDGCWRWQSSNCSFYFLWSVHGYQEMTKPGQWRRDFHCNKTSTEFVRR